MIQLAFVQPATRKSETNDGAASEARLEQLESELDLAYGKIEALSFQQHTSQDRSAVMFRQLQDELRDVKAQLVTKAKKVRVIISIDKRLRFRSGRRAD